MKCPHCDVDLVMSDRVGIEIDYCPKCRGVWLDRGELDKIIERSGAPVSPVPAGVGVAAPDFRREAEPLGYRAEHGHHGEHGHHDEHGLRGGHGQHHGKRSIWREIFD